MGIERVVKMADGVGLHGRPGALLVDLSRQFPGSTIIIRKGEKRAKATSLLNLLALGVVRGDEVTVEISGGNEETVLERVLAILQGKAR